MEQWERGRGEKERGGEERRGGGGGGGEREGEGWGRKAYRAEGLTGEDGIASEGGIIVGLPFQRALGEGE